MSNFNLIKSENALDLYVDTDEETRLTIKILFSNQIAKTLEDYSQLYKCFIIKWISLSLSKT